MDGLGAAAGTFGEKSRIFRYLRTVGSDTLRSRAISATVSPRALLLRILFAVGMSIIFLSGLLSSSLLGNQR